MTQRVHRIVLRLDRPTENGEPEVVLLTNLPADIPAVELAELYRNRWSIERQFAFLKEVLQGELPSLGSRGRRSWYCTWRWRPPTRSPRSARSWGRRTRAKIPRPSQVTTWPRRSRRRGGPLSCSCRTRCSARSLQSATRRSPATACA
ncbi:MAG: transposase [Isosphaeraceae bacterium]|nr:transposase [Isosphaeraceae bacterium]